MNYYNEIDPFAAEWLRELIKAGHLPDGDVDTRSIEDVTANDLEGYTQCHFFAGIGGWSYALKLAGWPEDRPVWTGSCPCQPFSTAGARRGVDDDRHLWPAFRWLIDQCRPATVFGEQVASKAGREWFTGVQTDLEAMGYDAAAADLCVASVGAPHIRQRLWWVGQPHRKRYDGIDALLRAETKRPNARAPAPFETAGASAVDKKYFRSIDNPWRDADWLFCRDGKWRRVEPGTFPLAHGIPARVGRLRGYGNAIAPQVAAEFILAADNQ